MIEPKTSSAKVFTVEEANASLPLVRAIVADIMELSQELADRRKRLAQLTAGRELSRSDLYGDELAHVEDEMAHDAERLQGYLDEITALGAEPKDPLRGLVDFPALFDGRFVYLCWKYGESEVLHWHELEAGFAGRQPLTVDTFAEGDAMDGGESL